MQQALASAATKSCHVVVLHTLSGQKQKGGLRPAGSTRIDGAIAVVGILHVNKDKLTLEFVGDGPARPVGALGLDYTLLRADDGEPILQSIVLEDNSEESDEEAPPRNKAAREEMRGAILTALGRATAEGRVVTKQAHLFRDADIPDERHGIARKVFKEMLGDVVEENGDGGD